MTLVWNTELLTQDVNKNQHDVKYAAVLNLWYGCVFTFRAICFHKRIEMMSEICNYLIQLVKYIIGRIIRITKATNVLLTLMSCNINQNLLTIIYMCDFISRLFCWLQNC